MEARITHNTQRNGLNVAFDRKPEAEVLSWLRGKGFRWNPYEKVWYIKYTPEREKETKDYFEGKEIPADDFGKEPKEPKGTNKIWRKLDLPALQRTGKKPRKDVVLREIQAGKMEYAAHSGFDGMTDSTVTYEVTDESWSPAETAEYLITRLKRATGQSHWVYSIYVGKSDRFGYIINFGDYYIRYKDEKPKEQAPAKSVPSESAEDKAIGLISGASADRVINEGFKFEYGSLSEPYYNILVGLISGLKADEIKKAGITIIPVQKDINIGDVVQLKETYSSIVKSSIGIVMKKNNGESRLYFGKNLSGHRIESWVDNYYFTVIETESEYRKRIETAMMYGKTAHQNNIKRIPAQDQRLLGMMSGNQVGDPRSMAFMEAWIKGYDDENLKSATPEVNEPSPDIINVVVPLDVGVVLTDGTVKFNTREIAERFLAKFPVLRIGYHITWVTKHYSQNLTGRVLSDGFYAVSNEKKGSYFDVLKSSDFEYYINRDAEEGSNIVIESDYDDEREKFGYDFDFYNGNKEGVGLKLKLQSNGIEDIEPDKDSYNIIEFTFRGNRFRLFDNSGEFKIDDLTGDKYIGVIDFKTYENKLKTLQELALEIFNFLSEYLKNPTSRKFDIGIPAHDLTEQEPEKEPEQVPEKNNDIEIARARAKARIRILQLRLKLKKSDDLQSKGKKINPHLEVSRDEALKEVISLLRFKDIGFDQAWLLAHLFFYADLEQEFIRAAAKGINSTGDEDYEHSLEDLETKEYFSWDGSYADPVLTLLDKGIDFIKTLRRRVDTRTGVKEGIDLFPEHANIPELRPSPEKEFAQGGKISQSQEFRLIYERAKNAESGNLTKFARQLDILNQYNEPMLKYLAQRKVPVIKYDEKEKKNSSIMFLAGKVNPSAIFWCLHGQKGNLVINNIYISVLPFSYIALGKEAVILKQPYMEVFENSFVHECIHAYINTSLRKSLFFEKEVETLREYMHHAMKLNDHLFNDYERGIFMNIYGDPIEIAQHRRPHFSEMIAYSFTQEPVKKFFQKVHIPAYNCSAWDKLINMVSINDEYGHLILYAQKYGDIPNIVLTRAIMKYKLYLKEGYKERTGFLKHGGLVKGKSHEEGGVPLTVKKTGEKIEVEGGEAIIMEDAVSSEKTYEFEGKQAKPQEILDKINRDHGGNPIK